MTMTFKEALIAHLHGKKVEVCGVSTNPPWKPFMEYHGNVSMKYVDNPDFAGACEYRIAPRTIMVNGMEVPAPENEAPSKGAIYYIPDISDESLVYDFSWGGCEMDTRLLGRGLIYLDKESAIARAKAMLITQEAK